MSDEAQELKPEVQITVDFNFVEYGYQVDVAVNGKKALVNCRDFGGDYPIEDLTIATVEHIDEALLQNFCRAIEHRLRKPEDQMIKGYAAFSRIQHLLQTNKWERLPLVVGGKDLANDWRQNKAVKLDTGQECRFIVSLSPVGYELCVEGLETDEYATQRCVYRHSYGTMTDMDIADIEHVIVNPVTAMEVVVAPKILEALENEAKGLG